MTPHLGPVECADCLGFDCAWLVLVTAWFWDGPVGVGEGDGDGDGGADVVHVYQGLFGSKFATRWQVVVLPSGFLVVQPAGG